MYTASKERTQYEALFTVVAFAISLVTLLAACGGEAPGGGVSNQGTLSGTITIGPVCPIEPCDQPAGAIYMGRELLLLPSGGSEIHVPLGEDGSFSASLNANTYVIRLDGCNFIGCDEAFPVEKIVAAGQNVTLNVNLDTGIRSAERNRGIGLLVSDLVGLGAVVATGDSITQPFFSVRGQEIIVNRETVQAFTYPSYDMT